MSNRFDANLTNEIFAVNNHPSFVYVIDSERLKSKYAGEGPHSIHMQIAVPVLAELKGYLNVYVFDCAHPGAVAAKQAKGELYTGFLASTCGHGGKDHRPTMVIYRRPELQFNPYTGERNKIELHNYEEKHISPPLLKKWITGTLSDYTSKVKTKRDYEMFVANGDDKDINKVIIFTKREKTAPALKALSAEYKDRLRISVISMPEGKGTADQEEIMKDYEVSDLPKLVVEETYDAAEDKVLQQYRIHEYKAKDFKINELISFLKPYARQEPKVENEDAQENRAEQKSDEQDLADGPKFHEVSPRTFQKQVLDSELAHLVYYTTLGENAEVTSEFRYFNRLIRALKGVVQFEVFRIDPKRADFAELAK